jgi:hypothetical protein
MFEAGKEPYLGALRTYCNLISSGQTIDEVIEHVLNGRHLECPAAAPPAIYGLMLKCWQWKPGTTKYSCSL